LPTIRAARDPLTRDLYLTRAAQLSGVDRDTLAREADSFIAPRQPPAPEVSRPAPRQPRQTRTVPGLPAERALIRAMLADPVCVDSVAEGLARIDAEALDTDEHALPALRDGRLREIHDALVEHSGRIDMEQMSEVLDPQTVTLLEELRGEAGSLVNLNATIDDSLARLKIRWREERIASLRGSGDDVDAVNAETLRLKKEILELRKRS
jgi:hypothetical protein